ncbi:MAG: ABC transporter permease subunit [Gemmatimonadetes bacterium]|jgi:multiple sugar transport system permease protein|nr:ABC transporter permease subunit [Gemmatimonadota bacterium]MBT4611204.1 ABC transporter permease subunit [Gemmatimonadota bacterium]MBT5060402.1 ABC transporter permease subunit [Gemmatimonadota bacterium]MBT5146057.1 ABC transporter permease subunit [Gemmatimonadota bacterium]MBT5591864.1 ABC transporter permease subunit [Gemmatimonadota bacterium]
MPVLTRVEAKSTRGIVLQTVVTIALTLGGVTMIYPFLLMLSGSVRSEMDVAQMDVVPQYLTDDDVLVRKFLEMKYCHDVGSMNRLRGYQDLSFELASLPESVIAARVHDLHDFAEQEEIPRHWWILGGSKLLKRISSANLRRLRAYVYEAHDGDLVSFGQELGAPLKTWSQLTLNIPEWTTARYDYPRGTLYDQYFRLLNERPLAERAFSSVTGAFLLNIVSPAYGTDRVDSYNEAHVQPIERFEDFVLPRHLPDRSQPTLREEWRLFVREILNVSFIRSDASDDDYRTYLARQYGTIDALNERWLSSFSDFAQVDLPAEREWVSGTARQDYAAFLEQLPDESLYLVSPEYAWQDWLLASYGDLASLNARYESGYASWDDIPVPTAQAEVAYVLANQRELRWDFVSVNFANVFYELFIQGRAFLNTVIFVVLALVLSLTLQPLAAYALSRFQPPGMWKLILLFMATMAFPPMVGMIPQFLILRQLDLLNTFIALVLPVVVNGYLIFLLKGFFDSLPRHLYEAALIDGASELRMFWDVTMSLSKPILAVVALQTFNIAWLMFLYPLLVCPDPSMHVLAVWLSEFQQEAPSAAVFASILIVSVPTMTIFLVTQRTIMRGIAVPAEK